MGEIKYHYQEVKTAATRILSGEVCADAYAPRIIDAIIDDVYEDVMASSGAAENGLFNDRDVQLAIGRTLLKRMGIPV